MKSSTDFRTDSAPSILCVGNPGAGKTRLMFGFPTPGIVDCDMNLSSAVRVMSKKEFYYGQPLINDKGDELPDDQKWDAAAKLTKEFMLDPRVKTICVDGLTAMSQWGLAHCERELVAAGINIKKEYLAKYQSFIGLMTNYITKIRLAKKTVFVTCHQTVDQNDLTKAWYYSLAIPGQLKDRLGGLFTDVWGVSTQVAGDNVNYYINTRPTNLHVALKTSYDLSAKIDVTNKDPEAVYKLLEPKLSIFNQPPTPPPPPPTNAIPSIKTP